MLIGICGKSGTGKSSLVKELENLGYKRIVTDTTRPPRKGEVNEVDYYFDSEEEFDELLEEGEFIETTSYKVASGDIWRYGTTRGAIAESKPNSVIILNPEGVKAFIEKIKPLKPLKIVHLISNERVILSRLEERGDTKKEILRRMEKDNEDFEGISDLVDFEIYNEKNTDLKQLAKMVIHFCEENV